MSKILVTGNAGSGKSTLSKELGKELNIPVYSLDKVVWKPGWQKPSPSERKRKLNLLLRKPEWVIDGVSTEVLEAADTIIFLDVPRYICYSRVLKRNIQFLFRSRPELPDNCPEILIIPKLIQLIWNFPSKVRPKILKFAHPSLKKRFFHVRTKEELNKVKWYLKAN